MITATIFLGMIGMPQVIIIVVAILLLFGGRKIPELMRGLGTGIKEFKNATKSDDDDEENKEIKDKKQDKNYFVNKKTCTNCTGFFYVSKFKVKTSQQYQKQ